MFEINNEWGQISFSRNVIYKICGDAVRRTEDARVQNYKGRYTSKKPGLLNAFSQAEEEYEDIELLETEEGLDITIYIVIRFGVSIRETANAILDQVYDRLQEAFGCTPASVKVVVTGTASKTIARRHIEFVRKGAAAQTEDTAQ